MMLVTPGSLTTCPLNEHVLEQIFEVVYETSYSTVQSLLLTNKLFNRIARPLLYRTVAFNIASSDFVVEIQSWLADPDKSWIRRAIRHISIERMYGKRLGQTANDFSVRNIGNWVTSRAQRNRVTDVWSAIAALISPTSIRTIREWAASTAQQDRETDVWCTIATLISQTTHLRSVTFSCRETMPLVLLQAIHNYPTALHLHLARWTRPSVATLHNDPAELELAGSPSLKSLQADIYNPEYNSRDLRIPAFWRIVRSAPNLQSVNLEIAHGPGCVDNRGGSEDDFEEWRVLAAAFERPSLPTQIQSSSGIRNLKIDGAKLSQWEGKDLSRVTNLEWAGNLPFDILRSLTSLTHLTLRTRLGSEAIDDLLLACPPLTSVYVIGWKPFIKLDTILARHGHSLRALGLHELEQYSLDSPRKTLSITELRRIRDACSHLTELCIDINIPENPPPQSDHLSTEFHRDVYDTLATFPLLRRLQLNYNLGISTYAMPLRRMSTASSTEYRARVPFADERFVEAVWRALNSGHTLSPIQELRVAQGEAQRHTGFGYYPVEWVQWEKDAHFWLKATPSERDDEPDGIRIAKYSDVPDFSHDIWRELRQ